MSIQPNHPPEDVPGASPALPSTARVVERLERLWSDSPPALVSSGGVEGLKFGRYNLEQMRGQGAFGIVYLARDTQLGRQVAIKIPRAHVLADGEKRRRFDAEASAAASLHHVGIVTVYEADLAGPTPYIASAYCPGPDLGEWLAARGGGVPWNEAALFVAALADAVQFAHAKGVYHRDLKPSNVLLMPQSNEPDGAGELGDYLPKLTDFGLAKLAQACAADTRSSLLIGTPLYMAPEQLEGNRAVPPAAADIYSLGCILYELVAGRPPIEGDTYAAMLDRLRETTPAPLRQTAADAPKDLETVCAKCLEKNPLARYGSAGELAADLRACVSGAPIEGRSAGLMSRLGYWATRPQRIRDAGWYTLCVQVLFAVWLTVAVAGAYFSGLLGAQQMPQMFLELGLLVGLVHAPMAVVGWFTTRHRPWAIRTGLWLSIVNLVLPPLFISLSVKPFFADLYAKIDASNYFMFTTCALMLLAELGQVALYGAAMAAWRRMTGKQ